MSEGPDITEISALFGDPARARMLEAMMAGLPLTAGELAREAGVTAQTASAHLARLRAAGLVSVEIQGRHRYYRIAGPDVAEALESLTGLAARLNRLRTRPGPRDKAMRQARTCYDHLAGPLAVALHDALITGGLLTAAPEGLGLTSVGHSRFIVEGIDIDALARKPRPLCRSCLDWSERRNHLAGSLGKALLDMMLARGWAKRIPATRALHIPLEGRRSFEAFVESLKAATPKQRAG